MTKRIISLLAIAWVAGCDYKSIPAGPGTGTLTTPIITSGNYVEIEGSAPYLLLDDTTALSKDFRMTLDADSVKLADDATPTVAIMSVDVANSRIGVGTTAPASQFDINSTAPVMSMTDTTTSAKDLTVTTDANAVKFAESATASTAIMSMDLANSRVGIGSTAPSSQLEVNSTAPVFSMVDTTASAKDLCVTTDADSSLIAECAAPSTSIMRVDLANSRVGVGTTAPSSQFEVNSTAPVISMVDTTASAKDLTVTTDGNASLFAEAATPTAGVIALDLANSRLAVGGTPYVANTFPLYPLHVATDGATTLTIDRYSADTGAPIILGRKGRGGSLSAISQTQLDDQLIRIQGSGYTDSAAFTTGVAGLYVYAGENFTSSAQGAGVSIVIVENGTTTQVNKFRVSSTGDVHTHDTNSELATSATAGQLMIATVNGTPTGNTTDRTGEAPFIIDRANDKACWDANSDGTWTCGGGIVGWTNTEAYRLIANAGISASDATIIVEEFDSPYGAGIGPNWTAHNASGGTVTGLDQYGVRADSSSTASSTGRIDRDVGASYTPHIFGITPAAWGMACKFRVATTIDAQTNAFVGVRSDSLGQSYALTSAIGSVSTTLFQFLAKDGTTLTTTASTISIDTNWHTTRIWYDGTNEKGQIDSETAITFAAARNFAAAVSGIVSVTNGTTAASQKLDVDACVYVVAKG